MCKTVEEFSDVECFHLVNLLHCVHGLVTMGGV